MFTWLGKKIGKCKHKDTNMGSVGGMLGYLHKDGSINRPLIFSECKKCGWVWVQFEDNGHLGLTEAEKEEIELINSFYNIKLNKSAKYENKNKRNKLI
jgi:hypothetical protein